MTTTFIATRRNTITLAFIDVRVVEMGLMVLHYAADLLGHRISGNATIISFWDVTYRHDRRQSKTD